MPILIETSGPRTKSGFTNRSADCVKHTVQFNCCTAKPRQDIRLDAVPTTLRGAAFYFRTNYVHFRTSIGFREDVLDKFLFNVTPRYRLFSILRGTHWQSFRVESFYCTYGRYRVVCRHRPWSFERAAKLNNAKIMHQILQGGPKSCTFFNTPYLWNHAKQNETDFTNMFLEFLEIKMRL